MGLLKSCPYPFGLVLEFHLISEIICPNSSAMAVCGNATSPWLVGISLQCVRGGVLFSNV